MKKIILFTSATFASGILFVNIYSSLVNAAAFEANIPDSIIAAREFFNTVNPGNFFKIFSPLTQLLALLALILFWKIPAARVTLALALFCYVSADIFTFAYFHPRNDIMFLSEKLPDTETLRRTAAEWSAMNWVRSFVVLVGVVCSFLSVHRVYGVKQL